MPPGGHCAEPVLFLVEGVFRSWKEAPAGNTARDANTGEVQSLCREARDLKDVVAEQTLELRLLKKSMIGDGEDIE